MRGAARSPAAAGVDGPPSPYFFHSPIRSAVCLFKDTVKDELVGNLRSSRAGRYARVGAQGASTPWTCTLQEFQFRSAKVDRRLPHAQPAPYGVGIVTQAAFGREHFQFF